MSSDRCHEDVLPDGRKAKIVVVLSKVLFGTCKLVLTNYCNLKFGGVWRLVGEGLIAE